jgi:hypothetical protein
MYNLLVQGITNETTNEILVFSLQCGRNLNLRIILYIVLEVTEIHALIP